MLALLGLDAAQEAAYRHLLATTAPHEFVTVAELVGTAVGEDAADVAARLSGLEVLGLVAAVGGDRWLLLPASETLPALVEQVAERRARTRALVADGQADEPAEHLGVAPVAREVVGWEEMDVAIRDFFAQMAQAARATEPTRDYDGVPMATGFELEAIERGVAMRVTYDHRALASPELLDGILSCVQAGEEARVAPVEVAMIVSDRPEVWIPTDFDNGEVPVRLRVPAGPLLDALLMYEELVWDRGIPVSARPADQADADEAETGGAGDELEARVVQLLANGHTEATIADHLGCHPRTAQRYVHDLCARLEATNRLQAGYQAVRRGWFAEPGGSAEQS